jgi:uncharacterized protein
MSEQLIPKIWELVEMLSHRGISIGVDEYAALKHSLRAGFGWDSREEFVELCSLLWAKSLKDRELLNDLLDELLPSNEWDYFLPKAEVAPLQESSGESTTSIDRNSPDDRRKSGEAKELDSELFTTEKSASIPPIDFQGVEMSTRRFILVPQFPLTDRQVAQIWGRLRRRVDVGTATELDIPETIERWSRSGVLTEMVLRPRQQNVASRLLILVDRQGSMVPFHAFCDHVCQAIAKSSQLGETAIYYFHNIPAEGADDEVLDPLAGQLFPRLDLILGDIGPCSEGDIYTDRDLLEPIELKDVLELHGWDSSVVIISDAGAARNDYRVSRLLETIAFMKALRTYTPRYVWLNPLAKVYWWGKNNTAGQIARHIPMFSLDREGMERSVNVLRGQEYPIEKSI